MIANVVLIVFAAASLHRAFPALATQFQLAHPGVSVRFDFDGSEVLETQLEQGADADVFASADERWMSRAQRADLVETPAVFARNQLAVLVGPKSSVRSLADLALPGVSLDLCAASVPCGAYARAALASLSDGVAFPKDFGARVLANVKSDELNVDAVASKVELGEVDAGFAYTTDAAALQENGVREIEVPASAQPTIEYPIAITKRSTRSATAQAFVAFVQSKIGQQILHGFGFRPAQ